MRVTALLPALALLGCGSPPPPQAAPGPSAQVAEPTPAPPATPSNDYEVHEWGVIDVAGNAVELSTGPGRPAVPVIARKPVVYFHLAPETQRVELSFAARMTGGGPLEHWPAGELTADSVRWPHVVATPGPCGEPARDVGESQRMVAQCNTPDGFCEVNELPSYVASDSACLDVAGAQATLLFYRASTSLDALPLEVTRAADHSISVRARRSLAGAPGQLLRVSVTANGRMISRTAAPSEGQSVTLPIGTAVVDPAAENSALERDLAALGMTPPEAHAFMTAWASTLFVDEAQRGLVRRGTTAGGHDVLLYWIPSAGVEAISALTIDPAPTAVHRAFLVRVDLGRL